MNVNWGHQQAAEPQGANGLRVADPLFFQRADCLDPRLVGSQVGAAFPEIDMSSGIVPANVWYIPGKSLQVVYRVIRTDDAGADSDTLVRVRFHPLGESGRHADFARAAAADRSLVRHIPDMSAVACLFPEDVELPQLRSVLSEDYIAKHLRPGGRWKLLSYLPGRRCAVRYRFPDDTAGMVVRVQTLQEAARSHGLARAAWSATSRRFRMPEPAGYDERAGAFWERFAPGQRLDSLLGTNRFDAALSQVVEGIVHLHALRLPDLPREGTSEVLDRTVRKILPKALAALPLLDARLEAFTRLLIARASQLDDADPVTLHGDLHTANLLLDAEGVVFIDLDRMSVGNPAYDLALLGTRLLLVALHGRAGVHAVADTIAALPALYREVGGRAIERKTFAWYVAALLVGRQIKTAIRHLAPNAESLAATLLAWAGRTLEQGTFDRSVLLDDTQGSRGDTPLARARRLRDSRGTQASRDEMSDVYETANQA